MKAPALSPFVGVALALTLGCADDRGDALGAPVLIVVDSGAGAVDQASPPPPPPIDAPTLETSSDTPGDLLPDGEPGAWPTGPVLPPWQIRWIGDPPARAPLDAADGSAPGEAPAGDAPADTSDPDAGSPQPDAEAPWAEAHADGSTFALQAGGAGIGVSALSDQFLFVHQRVRGEATLQAEVRRLAGCTGGRISFGLMVRTALDPGSAYAMAAVSGTPGAALQARRFDGYFASVPRIDNGVGLPLWLRVSRRAAQTSIGYSRDGMTWTESQVELSGLTEEAEFGLVASSHNGASACGALFADVTLQLRIPE
jgi:hypothetical protein